MSVTCIIWTPPDTMKPLPELPVRKLALSTVIEIPEPEPEPTPPSTPPSRLAQRFTKKHVVASPESVTPTALRVQRSNTAPGDIPVTTGHAKSFELDATDPSIILNPSPLQTTKRLTPIAIPPQPQLSISAQPDLPTPPYSPLTAPRAAPLPPTSTDISHMPSMHTLPRLRTQTHPQPKLKVTTQSSRAHHYPQQRKLDHLPTIETRLEAWIAANKHFAEPKPRHPHRDEPIMITRGMHGLRCKTCRYGAELWDLPRNTLGDSGALGSVVCECPTIDQGVVQALARTRSFARAATVVTSSTIAPVPTAAPVITSAPVQAEVYELEHEHEHEYEHEREREHEREQLPPYSEAATKPEAEADPDTDADINTEVFELDGRKSIWGKPSFQGFLVRVGPVKASAGR